MVILNSALQKESRTCWPKDGISNQQAVRIVVKYLNDNPAKLNKDQTFLTMMALREAYPCK
ncbi:hypothetical protein D3C75_1268560 [compost metagenome]